MSNNGINLYSYQKESVEFILNNIDNKHVLLAAAPNGGKTYISAFVIKELVKNGKRILCSVHGTNVLKKQFYDSICNIIEPDLVSVYDMEDLSLYDPKKPVHIMIFQNTSHMKECVDLYGKFDYLIVDEAHKFYNDTASMNLINSEYVSGNHLLLTGSPSIFKSKVNSGELIAKYLSASLIESFQEGQYDKEIRLDIVSNDVHLNSDDYNNHGEVAHKSEGKLKNNELVLKSLLVGDFGKTIIFVKLTSQADEIENYLNSENIINFTSHSKSDKYSTNIEIFRKYYTGKDNVVLIVVGRATEGFDDPNVSIIDITYSKNVNTLYQRYSRSIRKRTDAIDKRYVKVVPNNNNSPEIYVNIMTAILMLLKQKNYEDFNGNNFSIPTIRQIVKKNPIGVGLVKSYLEIPTYETNNIKDHNINIKSEDELQNVEGLVKNLNFNVSVTIDDNVYQITENNFNEFVNDLKDKKYKISIEKNNNSVNDCLLMETNLYSSSFFDKKNELYGYITRYATSNLGNVLRDISDGYCTYQDHVNFIKENYIKKSKLYIRLYKKSELKLISDPWRKFGNGSTKDYFESIWEIIGYVTNEEHIKYIKENDIKNSKLYSRIYKKSDFKLHSNPWVKFGNGSTKDYFESIWGEYYILASDEQHIKYIKENDIKNSNLYKILYKTSDLKLISDPWRKFGNGSSINYFESIWGEYNILASDEQHIKYIKENDIKSNASYSRLYKKSDLKLYSNPWGKFGNGSTKDYFESIWEIIGYVTNEEHIKYIKENNIRSGVSYSRLYKKSDLKLHSSPCEKFGNGSIKDYFEFIWGKSEELATDDQHIKYIKENNIRSCFSYSRLYKKSDLKLHSNPWKKFGNGSTKDYFESIWGEYNILASDEQHIKYIKENDIKSNVSYSRLYKKSDLKLHSNPWRKFGNGSSIDYFESIWEMIGYVTNEEHIKYIKENDIKGCRKYRRLYKTSDLKLHSTPWFKFGKGSVKDYFEFIWGKSEELATDEQHIKYIKENNIRSSVSYSRLYEISDLKLHSSPWGKFGNGSIKDYFEFIWGKSEELATDDQHIKYIKENDIKNSNLYKILYKKSDLKLHSKPWRKFGNGSIKDYFDSIYNNIEYKQTEKTSEQKIRTTQGIFRKKLLNRWNNKCAVSGIQNNNLLIASHIIPWSESNDFQRMDVNNGLLLASHFDNLFDKYLISFDQDGKILISDDISKSDLIKLGINGDEKIDNLTDENKKYLLEHSKKLL